MESDISRWLERVRVTEDEEISCSVCLDLISDYVDLEVATGDAAPRLPQVSHHLHQCAVCQEEYQLLCELARLEAEGDAPANEELIRRLQGPLK